MLVSEQDMVDAVSHAVEMVKHRMFSAIARYEEPSAIYKPKLTIDGNMWCALYGDNLQDGVAGFGESPAKAMEDFNKSWDENLKKKPAKV